MPSTMMVNVSFQALLLLGAGTDDTVSTSSVADVPPAQSQADGGDAGPSPAAVDVLADDQVEGEAPRPSVDPAVMQSQRSADAPRSSEAEGGESRADDPDTLSAEDLALLEEQLGDGLEVTIVGNRIRRNRVAGSAHTLNEEELERMEHDDIHRVLQQVPGVYVRNEDGFGLRPNIGLRGASSDRSAKVTLMEDGVLLAPAPYAAPAAYFFPNTTRLVGVEVFKGPASIKNGPQTVGGALNLQTRRVPFGFAGGLDLAAGAYGFGKLHGHVGYGDEYFGVLIEGLRLQSDGFKKIDGGGDTGFARNDVMLKARISNGYDAAVHHALELKLGFADEVSHETYLGLSDADFRRTPYRRYAASASDQMAWYRTQAQLSYSLVAGDFDLLVTAYRNDMQRDWNKLNRFRSSIPVSQVLAYPDVGQTAVLFDVLTGALNSETRDQALLIGNNGRAFYAQGVQARARYELVLGPVEQSLEVGARIHGDEIRRIHDEGGYLMTNGVLVPEADAPRQVITDNQGAALAGSLYLADEIRVGDLLVAPGIRFELIQTQFAQQIPVVEDQTTALQFAWMPGLGLSYQVLPALNLLAGIHKGFSPVSPGQPSQTLPEESVNYEVGGRLSVEQSKLEWIGFASQYSNLTGECTFSQGCTDDTLNRQYNAGEVLVYGFESRASQSLRFGQFEFMGELGYTLTLSRFMQSFQSDNPIYGRVEQGDELPYVPMHLASAQLLGRWGDLETVITGHYTSAMRDRAGQGDLVPEESTDEALLVDVGLSYRFSDAHRLYFRADNVTSQDYVSSRRPFGARPGKPLSYVLGFQAEF